MPWIIQEAFPAYHGVVWYWHDFDAPTNPHPDGPYLLRFWQVDYMAEVWLNGVKVGGHEGGEGVFVLDVTHAVEAGQEPYGGPRPQSHQRTHRGHQACRSTQTLQSDPVWPGALYNDGGIVDSVELLLTPAAYLTDLHLEPDPKIGVIGIRVTCRNTLPTATQAQFVVYRRGGVRR